MPLINVGQSCSPLSPPSGPTGPLYATTTVTGTPSTSYVVGLRTDSAGAYVYAGSALTVGSLTNGDEAKLYFTWDARINVTSGQLSAMGITPPGQPLIVGDSRLRYVTSNAAPSAASTIMIAYFPEPTDLANCKFITTTTAANLPVGAIDTKLAGSSTPLYTLTATPPGSNPSVPQRYFFLEKSYVAGGPKRYLGQDGNPYDVNQALANLSYIIPFTVSSQLTVTGAQTRITDFNLAGNARSAAVPSTSPVFTPTTGWVTINSVDYIATTILSQDQETIDATALANELDYIILSCVPGGSPTPTQVLGYTSSYATTLKSSYFAYGSTKYNYGYFIMVPLTTESAGSSSFMLLTGDGAKYLTLTSTNISYNDVPAGMLSTLSGSTSSYKFLAANYGAWTFETSGSGFKAKYTPPYSSTATSSTVASAVVVSSTSADTSTKAGVTSPSASYYLRVTVSGSTVSAIGDTAANGTVFTCTYCSPSNGMCMPGAGAFHGSPAVVVAGPALGTYTCFGNSNYKLYINAGNTFTFETVADVYTGSYTAQKVVGATDNYTLTFTITGNSSPDMIASYNGGNSLNLSANKNGSIGAYIKA